jgi:hypothetical protein
MNEILLKYYYFHQDPQGFVIRRWPSRNPTNGITRDFVYNFVIINQNKWEYLSSTGVVSLTYQLPSNPSVGNWTIRTEAMQQVHDYRFLVEHYYIPFFEVMPSAPAYVLDSDETYTVEVSTSVHSQFVANGNVTVHVYARPVNTTVNDYRLVKEELFPWVCKYHTIT